MRRDLGEQPVIHRPEGIEHDRQALSSRRRRGDAIDAACASIGRDRGICNANRQSSPTRDTVTSSTPVRTPSRSVQACSVAGPAFRVKAEKDWLAFMALSGSSSETSPIARCKRESVLLSGT